MDLEQIIPLVAFAGISLGAWAIISFFSKPASKVDKRLDELRDPTLRNREAAADKGMQGMLEKAAPTLSKALQPKSELEASELKVRLANAGFQSPNAPQLYLAIKVILLALGGTVGGSYGMLSFGMTQNGLTATVIGAGLGFYLPEIVLSLIKKGRQEKIFLSLPDALDLLVVCVEAGLGLDQGMRRVCEELKDTAPDLCNELETCNFQLQIGRQRREVLHDLGIRTGVDDVKALAAILIQSDKFGSSIAQALRVQSDSMRVKRRQLAEERAQQTAVKMIFPLVLFIFPGIFVVLVGPAALMLINGLLNK